MQPAPNEQEMAAKRQKITIPLMGTPKSSEGTPFVFIPTKNNESADFHPMRPFDCSALNDQKPNIKKPNFEIRLPFQGQKDPHIQQQILDPLEFQNFKFASVFNPENYSSFFSHFEEEYQINISQESTAAIFTIVIQQLHKIIVNAINASKQRTNMHMPPINKRYITSVPMLKHKFNQLELFVSSTIRNESFNVEPENDDQYAPYFYKNFDAKSTEYFNQEANPVEFQELSFQRSKIFKNLKLRGQMFKDINSEYDTNSNEKHIKYFERMDQLEKKSQTALPKPGPFNLKANEVFSQKEHEDQRKADRKIIPKDIFFAISTMPPAIKTQLPKWHLYSFGI